MSFLLFITPQDVTITLDNPTGEMSEETLAAHYAKGSASRVSSIDDHSDLVAEHAVKMKKREQAKRRAKEKETSASAKKFKF